MIPLILAAVLAISPTCDLEKPSGAPGCTRVAVDALPMTAIQVIGTHNSYKAAIAPSEMAALKAGLIVRTRADADTVEARTKDRTTQIAAFNSGAHYVSTDYMTPDVRLSSYEAHLPGGGVARVNPVTKP